MIMITNEFMKGFAITKKCKPFFYNSSVSQVKKCQTPLLKVCVSSSIGLIVLCISVASLYQILTYSSFKIYSQLVNMFKNRFLSSKDFNQFDFIYRRAWIMWLIVKIDEKSRKEKG